MQAKHFMTAAVFTLALLAQAQAQTTASSSSSSPQNKPSTAPVTRADTLAELQRARRAGELDWHLIELGWPSKGKPPGSACSLQCAEG